MVHVYCEVLGRKPNATQGLYLVHLAAAGGHLEMVKLLVQCMSADINAKDTMGKTPLHYAVNITYASSTPVDGKRDLISTIVNLGAHVPVILTGMEAVLSAVDEYKNHRLAGDARHEYEDIKSFLSTLRTDASRLKLRQYTSLNPLAVKVWINADKGTQVRGTKHTP
jgi:hypothetical protein